MVIGDFEWMMDKSRGNYSRPDDDDDDNESNQERDRKRNGSQPVYRCCRSCSCVLVYLC